MSRHRRGTEALSIDIEAALSLQLRTMHVCLRLFLLCPALLLSTVNEREQLSTLATFGKPQTQMHAIYSTVAHAPWNHIHITCMVRTIRLQAVALPTPAFVSGNSSTGNMHESSRTVLGEAGSCARAQHTTHAHW